MTINVKMRGRANQPGRLVGRVVAGTGVYAVIVVSATSLPAAAGLMQTFPALNGLAFYFSENERAAAIAKTMLWMPVVNAALCAVYVVLFLLLAKTLPPTALGWGLLALAATAWFAWVSRKHVRAGIDPPRQLLFATCVALAGLALAAATMLLMLRLGLSPARAATASNPAHASWLAGALAQGAVKIALFALTLAIVLTAIEYVPISDSTRGILAGLPIVPFGGLVSIACDVSMSADSRVHIFRGMMAGVWLGPAIAVWYIFCFSRYLGARKKAQARAADALLRFGALSVAWLITFAAAVAVACALDALGVHAANPGL